MDNKANWPVLPKGFYLVINKRVENRKKQPRVSNTQLSSMTHLMLMTAVGKKPKHTQMYIQIHHYLRVVAVSPVLYNFKPFTPHFIFLIVPAAIWNHSNACLIDGSTLPAELFQSQRKAANCPPGNDRVCDLSVKCWSLKGADMLYMLLLCTLILIKLVNRFSLLHVRYHVWFWNHETMKSTVAYAMRYLSILEEHYQGSFGW